MTTTTTEPQVEIGTNGFSIPLETVLTGRAFCFGKSGSGKSNTASVVLEEVLEQGYPCLVVDTDGEYYGLKQEYEVLHATGDSEGDIEVGPEHADRLATLAIEEDVPVVLDVSAFLDPDDADELVGKIARGLFAKAKKLRKPFLFVVEEAHEYIPQQGSPGFAGEHITRIARRGRKHGLGFLGISQRPANAEKDVVTQCNWLVWHRLTYETDLKTVKSLYGSTVAEQIPELADGEAWIEADWLEDLMTEQIRRKRTFDAGATPGLDETARPKLRSIDEDVVQSLRESGEAARTQAERIEHLEQRRDELEARVDELEQRLERERERNVFQEQIAGDLTSALGDQLDIDFGGEGSIKADVMEVYEQNQALDEQAQALREKNASLQEAKAELEGEVERLETRVDELEAVAARDDEAGQFLEDVQGLVDRYPGLFDVDGETDDRLRARLHEQTERIEDLEQQLAAAQAAENTGNPLEHEAVQEAVETVAEKNSYDGRHYWDVLDALAMGADGEFIHPSEVAPYTDVSQSSVADILRTLHGARLVDVQESGRKKRYALNRDVLEQQVEIYERQARRATQREE